MSLLDDIVGTLFPAAGRAEQMVRERSASQQSAVVQPSASRVPWMWVLGLGGAALWFLTRKR